jgi:transcriptional regulator with XRE-family HTH domain
MSQQDFADRLNVKRSNVAAYETKNVEPRLALLLEIAKLLNVNIGELLSTDLSLVPLGQQSLPERFSSLLVQFQELAEKNAEIASMVNGFQLFFEFKQQELQKNTKGTNSGDIENFLIFLSHMRTYNQSVTEATDAVVKRNEVPVLSH